MLSICDIIFTFYMSKRWTSLVQYNTQNIKKNLIFGKIFNENAALLNKFGQLQRWFLYPPEKTPSFHPNRTTLQWLIEDYPKLHPQDYPLDCTINQGEVSQFIYPSIFPSIHPFIHPFFHPSIHPFFHPSICVKLSTHPYFTSTIF